MLPDLDKLPPEEAATQVEIIALKLFYSSQEIYNNSGNNLSYGLAGVSVLPFFHSGLTINKALFWKLYHLPKKEFKRQQSDQVYQLYTPYKKVLGVRINVVLFSDTGWNDGKVSYSSFYNNLSTTDCISTIAQSPSIATASPRYVNKAIGYSLGVDNGYAHEGTIMSSSDLSTAFSTASGIRIREAAFFGRYQYTEGCRAFSIHNRAYPNHCDALYELYLQDAHYNPNSLCIETKENLCGRFGFGDPSVGIGREDINHNPFDNFQVQAIELTKQANQTVTVKYIFSFQYHANYTEQGIDRIYADGLASWASPNNQYAVKSLFYEHELIPGDMMQNKFFELDITRTIDDRQINFKQPIICGVQLRYRKQGVWYKKDFGTVRIKMK